MMLKKLLAGMALLVAVHPATIAGSVTSVKDTAGVKGIFFTEDSWNGILKKAKAENKMVFMDCFTTWCGPCKILAKTVFKDPKVGEYMNRTFINVTMDMEKGEGISLAKTFGVKAYPTLLFIDVNGNEVHRVAGAISSEEFIRNAEIAQSGKGLTYYISRYKEGERDTAFLHQYINAAVYGYMMDEAQAASEALFKIAGMDYITSPTGWDIFNYVVTNPYAGSAAYFWDNIGVVIEKVGKDKVDKKVSSLCDTYSKSLLSMHDNSTVFDEAAFNKFFDFLVAKKIGGAERYRDDLLMDIYLVYLLRWSDFANLADQRVAKGDSLNLDRFESYLYSINSGCKDNGIRKRAVRWADAAIKQANKESASEVAKRLEKLKAELGKPVKQ